MVSTLKVIGRTWIWPVLVRYVFCFKWSSYL